KTSAADREIHPTLHFVGRASSPAFGRPAELFLSDGLRMFPFTPQPFGLLAPHNIYDPHNICDTQTSVGPEDGDASSKRLDPDRSGGSAVVRARTVVEPTDSGDSANRGRQAEPFRAGSQDR